MSTGTRWGWLIERCISQSEPFAPGVHGAESEPFVSYGAIADLVKRKPEYVRKVATTHKLRRHPSFPGLIRWSDFLNVPEATHGEET